MFATVAILGHLSLRAFSAKFKPHATEKTPAKKPALVVLLKPENVPHGNRATLCCTNARSGSGGIDLGLGLDLGGDFRGCPLIGVYEWRTVDSHDRWKGFPNSVLPKFSARRRGNGGNWVEIG